MKNYGCGTNQDAGPECNNDAKRDDRDKTEPSKHGMTLKQSMTLKHGMVAEHRIGS
ncbi:MAG: hypothetical protein FWD57_09420 [Polyangiaceae bacterium]|nr:hypothetical protein [Polyangiaceae bacterium]